MSIQIVVHVTNEEAFVADVEDLPPQGATYITLMNPRTRDNKHLQWAMGGALRYIFPFSRISFIEIMMSEQDREGIEPFFRDRGGR